MSEVKGVAIYARVSSERQDIDLFISAQLKALRKYASRNGYSMVKRTLTKQRANGPLIGLVSNR